MNRALTEFDYGRAFCLVASVQPPLVLVHEGMYLRRACEPFATADLARRYFSSS